MKIVSGVPAAIPVVGDFMVELLRGGESVGQATLTRFYSLHTFVMPWLLAVFMLCLLYTSPSPRDSFRSRMPSSA